MEPVAYRISQGDYIALLRLFAVRAIPRFVMIMAAVVAAVAVVAVPLGAPEAAYSAVATAVIIVPVLLLLARYVIIPLRGGRTFREYALIREEMTLTLSGEGFAIAQASGHVAMTWSDMLLWDESDQIFALHPTRELAYILPKQAIGHDRVALIKQKLTASGLPRKGKRRK